MKGKYCFVFFVLLLSINLLFSGCEREKAEKVSLREVKSQPSLLPEKKGLKIAVSAIISPKKTFIYYKEILDYLSRKIDAPIELVQRDTYAEVNHLVKDEQIHAAFVCSGAYIDGHKDFGMELLVAPKAYGEPYYYSYVIVPVDSETRKLEDLRGKKYAFTYPMSNTGKLVPIYMLAMMGETSDSFFSKTIFTYSHDKSIEAVAHKLVDGASVDSLIWDYANVTNPEFTSKTRVIKKSPPYGIPPVVVPKGLDPKVKKKLREALLNMHLDAGGKIILEKVKIGRFIVIEDRAYDSIREMRKFVNKAR
jgi:phosphonate transport system substrate-binding protein